jgi:hypothetical protein
MRILLRSGLVTLFFIFAASPFCGAETAAVLTPREIVQRSEDIYAGEDMVSFFQVRLINEKGQVRQRKLVRFRRDEGGITKDLLKFIYPNDIKNVGTLNEEAQGQDDIQYLYLPASKKLRRVSAKNQSWVGTDLSYEDTQTLKTEDYDYELLGSDEVDGDETYKIALTVRDSSKSMYSKRIYYIRKADFYLKKAEFYDKKGRLLKYTHQTDIQNIDGALYAASMKWYNVQDNHRTEFQRVWIRINNGIPDEVWTTRNLEKSVEFYKHPKDLNEGFEALEKQSGAS